MVEKLEGILSEGYGIMPIIILRSDKLNDKQKLLYCLISSLCAERGFCRASNKYLGDVLNVGARVISKNINALAEMGLIIIEIKHGKERKIKLNSRISKKLLGFLNNDSEKSLPSENSLPLGNITSSDSEKSLAPLGKITSTPNEYGQVSSSENPGKLMPNNIIEYYNSNNKENKEKNSSTANAVSPDIMSSIRSEKNNKRDVSEDVMGKCDVKLTQKQKRHKEIIENEGFNSVLHTIGNKEGQDVSYIDSLWNDWIEIKCNKNLKGFTDRSVKIALGVLNKASCYREQLVMLTKAVAGGWSGQHLIDKREKEITEYDDKLILSTTTKPRVSGNMFH